MTTPRISLLFFAAAFGLIGFAMIEPALTPPSSPPAPRKSKPSAPSSAKTSIAAPNETQNEKHAHSTGFYFNALNPGAPGASTVNTTFDPSDDYWGLPRAPGYEEVSLYCVSCHSLQLVMAQRANETRWRELLDWMVEKQGMAPIPHEDEKRIIAYLAAEFSN